MVSRQPKTNPQVSVVAEKRSRGVVFALALVLVVVTFIAYLPAIRGGFIWDDDTFLTNNQLIKASDGLYRFWFTTEPPDYFPLTSSMLWVEWRLWGMNATGYHVVNVLLHAVSAVLLWLVLSKLKIPGAWLAGLVFGIHPVNVESVAWITERKNTLPMMFYLATILLYLNFESRQRKSYYVLAIIAFLLALLSKTSVVMLPLVLLIVAWWQRGRIDRKDIYRLLPFLGLAIALGLVTCWFQHNRAISVQIIRTDGFPGRLAVAGWAVWFYLGKALVPYRLTFVYPRWQIDPSSVTSYLPGVALLTCFILFWRYRTSWGRPLLAGLGYYVITLLPILGFVNIYFMRFSLVADHWQYTSIIGVIALAIGLATTFAGQRPKILHIPATILAIVVVGVLLILSWRQGSIYANSETLWQDTLNKNPSAWIAHNNLGLLLANKGKPEEAMRHYNEALRLKADYDEAYYNRGVIYDNEGAYDLAIRDYGKVIEITPDYAEAYCARGNAYDKKGDREQAIRDYDKAIEIKPDFAESYNNRGIIYQNVGAYDQAIRDYTKAIEIKPDFAKAYCNRGVTYHNKGAYDQAIRDYTKAIEIKPDFAETYINRGAAYQDMRAYDQAIRDYSRAIEIKPDFAEAYENRVMGYYLLKQYDQAWADVGRFQQLGGKMNPEFIKALTRSSSRPE